MFTHLKYYDIHLLPDTGGWTSFLRDRLISFHKTVTGLDRLKLKIDGSNDQNGLNLARCGHSRFARLVYFEMKQAKMWTLV